MDVELNFCWVNVSIFRPDFFSIFHLLSLFNDDPKIEPKIDPRKTTRKVETADRVLSLACAWRLAVYFGIVRVEMHVTVKHPSVTSLWLLCSPQKLWKLSCKGIARKCFNLSSSPLQSRVYRLSSPACFGVSTYLTCDSWASLEFGIRQFTYQSTFLIIDSIYRPYTKTPIYMHCPPKNMICW
jgi:hypothetical protein